MLLHALLIGLGVGDHGEGEHQPTQNHDGQNKSSHSSSPYQTVQQLKCSRHINPLGITQQRYLNSHRRLAWVKSIELIVTINPEFHNRNRFEEKSDYPRMVKKLIHTCGS